MLFDLLALFADIGLIGACLSIARYPVLADKVRRVLEVRG